MSTHRQAKVMVQNCTGQKILSVSVGHKYSDDYNNKNDWKGPIDDNSTTSDNMLVDYTTGAFTTGRDWWTVSWVTEDGKSYVTDPDNFRGTVDFIENIGSKVSAPLATLAVSITTALALAPEPTVTKAAAAAVAAVAVTSLVVGGMCNSESTSGFKQHILREEDQDEPIKIILNTKEVKFHSKSGDSTTGFSRLE